MCGGGSVSGNDDQGYLGQGRGSGVTDTRPQPGGGNVYGGGSDRDRQTSTPTGQSPSAPSGGIRDLYDLIGVGSTPAAPQPQGISTQFGPSGGAPLAGTGVNYDPAVTKAAIALQGFEGFVPKAFFDVNAPRVGWSSDTITDPVTGKSRPVTMEDTISVEDANVDLNKRIVGIQNTLANTIGQEAWDNLPTGAKAAMTSVGYQYGSVPKSVVSAAKSGNPESISKAISELTSTPSRRAEEAKLSLSDKVINAGLNMIPGIVHPALGLANLTSGVLGGPTAASLIRGNGNVTITPTDPGSMQNSGATTGFGPDGSLTREQYQQQYGNSPNAIANIVRAAAEPVTNVSKASSTGIQSITPQKINIPAAPGTTPNTRLSDTEYAALSPLEKAYYDMGISGYGTFGPEYNYFKDRKPIYIKDTEYRHGGLVKGPGTETSDSVPALIGGKTPAALSNGEFVFTGQAVRGMGNGDRMEGARKLHQMMKKAEGNASKGGPRK